MRELRLVLLGLAALIALSLSVGFLLRAFRLAPPPSSTSEPMPAPEPVDQSDEVKAARANIERAILDKPDYSRFYDQLRLVYPSDYEIVMRRQAEANVAVKDVNVDKVMLDTVTALRHAHGAQMAKASDAALSHYFTVQTQEVHELGRRDAHLCVVFAAGAQAAGFLGFLADHRPLVAEAAIASLDAMNSGRMDQVVRAVPSDDDLQALDHALVEAGLSRPEISSLLDDTPADPPISDERMCKAQEIYLTTVASLAPDLRSRLYALWADLMAKS